MRIFIVGTGSHARKAYHCALACGYTVAGFLDDDPAARSPFAGVEVLGLAGILGPVQSGDVAFVAIGQAGARRRVMDDLAARGWVLPPLVHPSAVVSADASLGPGVLVAAGAVVETGSAVGRGAIVDIGVMIDHDCRVGAWCHLRPGAVLAPRSVIEEGRDAG